MLEITVKGEPQEIAALAAALQGRQEVDPFVVTVDRKDIFKGIFEATHDMPQEREGREADKTEQKGA